MTVSFSSSEDVENIDNQCYSAQRRLLQIIKTDTNTINVSESDLFVTFTDFEDDVTLNTACGKQIFKFLHSIEIDSQKEDSGTRPNPYYCPDFGVRLLKLSRHFLLWIYVHRYVHNFKEFDRIFRS